MEYRVLARKYRPTTFADLIGQEVLVQTLSNAIATGRLAHAFLLTGIRGVGKTTTARIIARALNCIGADGNGGPTTNPCGVCPNCTMIAEDRHPDVIEMDAASRTGVDGIRDIIETVRYAPTSARTKIYIIDEVHMLSTSAFNALLKTLEEPPAHVKFIFATTEARKIPVTILSRCQRFDLKRVPMETLATHLGNIATKEQAKLEQDALNLIAIAAEGSVRDSLSLLDQALAQHSKAGEAVSAETVRGMLGLADKTQTISLLKQLLNAQANEALETFSAMYRAGADPLLILQDVLEFTHFITRVKLAPQAANDPAYSETERTAASELSSALTMPKLTRLWQLLLKGVNETKLAPSPVAAAEMVLVRAGFASDLPTLHEVAAEIKKNPSVSAPSNERAVAPSVAPVQEAPPAPKAAPEKVHVTVENFTAMVHLFETRGEMIITGQLKQYASLVNFAPGQVTLHMTNGASREFVGKLALKLGEWTGHPWKIILATSPGEPTLHEQEITAKTQQKEQASGAPMVASILEQFPGAEVTEIRESA